MAGSGKYLLFFLMFVSPFLCFAQDTTRVEPFLFDTTLFEKAPVDTVTKSADANVEKSQSQVNKISNIYYGGSVILSFGSYTVIGIEPMLAYKLTPKFSVGTKLTYEYIHEKQGSYVYKESNYGFSLFNRLRVTQRLYTHVEYSSMNYKFYNEIGSERKWVPFLFVGGGLSQPISKNTWLNAEILFDVLQNKNSPYNDWEPFYSVGFGVGF
jgi:hypothetical protein